MSNRVYFLNPPSGAYNLTSSEYDLVSILDYPGFWKGLHRLPKSIRKLNLRKVYRKIESLIGERIDVIWSFDNSVFFDFDLLPTDVLKVSHIVDFNQDFQFERAARTADICLGSTSGIVNKQRKYNANSFFVNHGCTSQKSQEYVLETSGLSIGYGGNLEIPYLDWELLNEAFRQFPQATFYFAGPGKPKTDASNVTYLGELSKGQLLGFIERMDLLIIVYRADEFKDQLSNPHKMMEYLSTGKPVVATYTEEYKDHQHLIAMSETNQVWIQKLGEVINHLEEWSAPALVTERKEIVAENTYIKQIHRIERFVDSVSNPL